MERTRNKLCNTCKNLQYHRDEQPGYRESWVTCRLNIPNFGKEEKIECEAYTQGKEEYIDETWDGYHEDEVDEFGEPLEDYYDCYGSGGE